MKYVAAIDQGTTSSRCILFDRNGPVAAAQREHQQIYPRPGWVEHDPLEIWSKVQETIAGAVEAAGARPGEIGAVGITNQRETLVVWDKRTGQPLSNAIVWQDTRTRGICDALAAAGGQDRYRQRVGLPLATYFSGPKLQWMLHNVEGLADAARSGRAVCGTIDTWLIWNLTGGPDSGRHVTDVTNASRTMLMNLETLQWDPSMLETFGVPTGMLPEIISSSHATGFGQTRAPGPLGPAPIPITACLGDQHAALFGQTCFEPGESKNTYGTGCFMLLNTGAAPVQSRHGLLTTLGYKIGDSPAVYALEGSVAVAGALVQWMRDKLGLIATSADIETLAATVPDNGGVYFVPAFSGLFAPHWRSDARGIIAGLTGFAGKGHLARAGLEATAFQTRDVLDAMRKDSQATVSSLRVDGGMAVNDLLMQFQADILGVRVVRPTVTEITALGAAYAAGIAVGFWSDLSGLRRHWKADKVWEPRMSEEQRQSLHQRWLSAVQRSMGWES